MRTPVFTYRQGKKVIVVYDDDSVEEHTLSEEDDLVSSICPDCGKIECICGRKK